MLATGEYQQRSRELGTHMLARFHQEQPAAWNWCAAADSGPAWWCGRLRTRPPALRACAGVGPDHQGDARDDSAAGTPLMIDEQDLDRGIDIVLEVLT